MGGVSAWWPPPPPTGPRLQRFPEDAPARLLRAFSGGSPSVRRAPSLRRGLPLEDGASSPKTRGRSARHPTRVFPFLQLPRPGFRPRPRLRYGAAPSARTLLVRPGREGATSRSAPSPKGSPRSPGPKQPPPPPAPPRCTSRSLCAVARRDDVNAPHWLLQQGPVDWLPQPRMLRLQRCQASPLAGGRHRPLGGRFAGRQASGDHGAAAGRAGAAAGCAGAAASVGARVSAAERAAAEQGADCPWAGS